MRPARLTVLTAAAVVAALSAVTGCSEKSDASGDGVIHVTATDTACDVSTKEFPAGKVQFEVANKGEKVTELYVLFPDGRIVAERENIGAGTQANITAEIKPGSYEIACKPGMTGDGIRQQVKATGQGATEKRSPEADAAVAAYRKYVQEQADETLPKAQAFADAVKAGDVEAAKKAYAPRASAGSAPSRSPSPSVTSTPRSTSARTAWRPARSGPAGTSWRSPSSPRTRSTTRTRSSPRP